MAPITSATSRPSVAAPTATRPAAPPPPPPPPSPARATGHSTADVFERPVGEASATSRVRGPVTESSLITPGGRETWRGSDILRNLGQMDGTTGTHAPERCAASSTLATAIMSGAPSTDRFVLGLVRANEGRPEVRAELTDIYGRLGRGTATYGDMHRLQDITFSTFERDGRPGSSPSEIAAMRGLSRGLTRDADRAPLPGDTVVARGGPDVGTAESPDRTRARIDALRPGESFMMNIDAGGDDIRHAVTIGRDRDGSTYLYDSAPADGNPTFMYEGERPELFAHYTDGSLGSAGTTPTPMNLIVNSATQRDW